VILSRWIWSIVVIYWLDCSSRFPFSLLRLVFILRLVFLLWFVWRRVIWFIGLKRGTYETVFRWRSSRETSQITRASKTFVSSTEWKHSGWADGTFGLRHWASVISSIAYDRRLRILSICPYNWLAYVVDEFIALNLEFITGMLGVSLSHIQELVATIVETFIVLFSPEPRAEALRCVGVKVLNWAVHGTFQRIVIWTSVAYFLNMVLDIEHNTGGAIVEAWFGIVFRTFSVPPWACGDWILNIKAFERTVFQTLRQIIFLVFFVVMLFIILISVSAAHSTRHWADLPDEDCMAIEVFVKVIATPMCFAANIIAVLGWIVDNKSHGIVNTVIFKHIIPNLFVPLLWCDYVLMMSFGNFMLTQSHVSFMLGFHSFSFLDVTMASCNLNFSSGNLCLLILLLCEDSSFLSFFIGLFSFKGFFFSFKQFLLVFELGVEMLLLLELGVNDSFGGLAFRLHFHSMRSLKCSELCTFTLLLCIRSFLLCIFSFFSLVLVSDYGVVFGFLSFHLFAVNFFISFLSKVEFLHSLHFMFISFLCLRFLLLGISLCFLCPRLSIFCFIVQLQCIRDWSFRTIVNQFKVIVIDRCDLSGGSHSRAHRQRRWPLHARCSLRAVVTGHCSCFRIWTGPTWFAHVSSCDTEFTGCTCFTHWWSTMSDLSCWAVKTAWHASKRGPSGRTIVAVWWSDAFCGFTSSASNTDVHLFKRRMANRTRFARVCFQEESSLTIPHTSGSNMVRIGVILGVILRCIGVTLGITSVIGLSIIISLHGRHMVRIGVILGVILRCIGVTLSITSVIGLSIILSLHWRILRVGVILGIVPVVIHSLSQHCKQDQQQHLSFQN